jgi:hypothetical protein
MRAFQTCLDCGVRVSRYDAKRCGPCASRERTARRLATAPSCLDCGRPLYDARSTRCRACNNRLAHIHLTERPHALVVCPPDGWPVEGHPRCRGCTALVGAVHTQQMGADGTCDACWRPFDRVALDRVDW